MRAKWKTTTLSNIISFINGQKRPKEKGQIPVYGGNGILDYTNRNNYENCVIIGRVGVYCGTVYYESKKCWVSDNAIVALPLNENNIHFIYYLLKNLKLNNHHIGTSQPLLTQGILNGIECNIPDIETQKKIASILSVLDAKIELNNAINENLEQQAQAIFKSWFIDTKNKYRKICRCDEYFDISIGKTPPRNEHQYFTKNKNDIIWVSISDMGDCGMFIENSFEYLTKEAIDKFNIKEISANTVLLSFKLTVGRVSITAHSLTTNEAIAHFKTENKSINEYLYFYLKQFNYQTLGNTSSIAVAINSKIIKSMPFIIPTDEEISNFHTLVSPMFSEILKNQRENQRLASIRDTLLPKLMKGEIDVSKVKI